MVRKSSRLAAGVAAIATVALAAIGGLTAVTPAGAAPAWAPAATAAIHPGVQTFTAGAQCTANFVFTDGGNVYIGQAAHCSGTGGKVVSASSARRKAGASAIPRADGRTPSTR